jgi:hypothetical protein
VALPINFDLRDIMPLAAIQRCSTDIIFVALVIVMKLNVKALNIT